MNRDALIGVPLAILLLVAFFALLVWSLFVWDWQSAPLLVPLIVAFQCWLYVGIFIVAHDAIHGTVWPGAPLFNRRLGAVCLFVYAGFRFSELARHHHAHHAHSGNTSDPDFCADAPRNVVIWYISFFRHYFGLRQVGILFVFTLLLSAAGVDIRTLLIFWALPAVLSSMQLFYFGTFLPHRHEDQAFSDPHNARNLNQSWLASLLSCFHFGHHHTHHDAPSVPWWRLPSASKELRNARP